MYCTSKKNSKLKNSKGYYKSVRFACVLKTKLFGYYSCVTILPMLTQNSPVLIKDFVGGE